MNGFFNFELEGGGSVIYDAHGNRQCSEICKCLKMCEVHVVSETEAGGLQSWQVSAG